MLGQHFGQRKDSAARAESGGTRPRGERIIEPGEIGGRDRNTASPQGFERRIQLRPQIHSPHNAPKLDDLAADRERRHQLRTLQRLRLIRQRREAAIHAALQIFGRPR